ncbi:Glycosyltransferase involved in cell wall bisynthesis [Saccharicrinis carchari]|uniref:Glycosyltransferase involved in cell wall bisynthesis n=1 Tax=Saccharicrinis carchari TaxID=1168039 RepID=A0A521BTG7_SACCC|nr:glycosyltransferase family 4 protein [Saccharicrinis carchari]SMO50443.1 Glycosyltransferase involved in cell wall bisynthesis [Saccharicrinis carchari]
MREITIINQDSGYLMIDIANDYARKGYRTTLIAGRIVERDVPLDSRVQIYKIMRYNRSSNFKRLLSWFVSAVQIWVSVLFRFRKSHLLIVSNPPFAPLLPMLLSNSYSLLIFDLYPDALSEYGFVNKKSPIVKLWSLANKKVYAGATKIYTLTNGMRQAMSSYISTEKINIVPLWTNNSFLKPVPKGNNPFIKQHGLQDKFVVLYSGNFGYTHQVDLIIDLAAKINHPKILFVLVGGGRSEGKLKERLVKEGIGNCRILPWQEVDMLPYSLSSADLSIVSLSENASALAIPSKVFNYMSVGSPILAIAGSGSDLESLILENELGKSFTPDQSDRIIAYIKELADNSTQCHFYSNNALKTSEKHTAQNVELITQFDV